MLFFPAGKKPLSEEEVRENEALIEKIDGLIERTDYIGDEHFFDEFLEKWDRGEYHD